MGGKAAGRRRKGAGKALVAALLADIDLCPDGKGKKKYIHAQRRTCSADSLALRCKGLVQHDVSQKEPK